jgi:hypothetical protein
MYSIFFKFSLSACHSMLSIHLRAQPNHPVESFLQRVAGRSLAKPSAVAAPASVRATFFRRRHVCAAAVNDEDTTSPSAAAAFLPSAVQPAATACQGPQEQRLSAPGKAAAVTGAYITVAGLAVFVCPALLRLLFSASACVLLGTGWTRVLATLAAAFGTYYLGSAFTEWSGVAPPLAFYRSTVFGRLLIAAAFAALYLSGDVREVGIVLLGAVNAAGALAMHLALQTSETS